GASAASSRSALGAGSGPHSPESRATPRVSHPKDRGRSWGLPRCEPRGSARILIPSSTNRLQRGGAMRNYVFVIAAAAALLAVAGVSWIVHARRPPVVREGARPGRIDVVMHPHQPPPGRLRRRPDPAAGGPAPPPA